MLIGPISLLSIKVPLLSIMASFIYNFHNFHKSPTFIYKTTIYKFSAPMHRLVSHSDPTVTPTRPNRDKKFPDSSWERTFWRNVHSDCHVDLLNRYKIVAALHLWLVIHPGRCPPGLGRRDTGSPPNKMSSMDAGKFVVPSPETLTSEDEQPSSAQKPPPETCHENVFDDDLIP